MSEVLISFWMKIIVAVIDNSFNVGKSNQVDENIRPATEIEKQWARVLLNVSA